MENIQNKINSKESQTQQDNVNKQYNLLPETVLDSYRGNTKKPINEELNKNLPLKSDFIKSDDFFDKISIKNSYDAFIVAMRYEINELYTILDLNTIAKFDVKENIKLLNKFEKKEELNEVLKSFNKKEHRSIKNKNLDDYNSFSQKFMSICPIKDEFKLSHLPPLGIWWYWLLDLGKNMGWPLCFDYKISNQSVLELDSSSEESENEIRPKKTTPGYLASIQLCYIYCMKLLEKKLTLDEYEKLNNIIANFDSDIFTRKIGKEVQYGMLANDFSTYNSEIFDKLNDESTFVTVNCHFEEIKQIEEKTDENNKEDNLKIEEIPIGGLVSIQTEYQNEKSKNYIELTRTLSPNNYNSLFEKITNQYYEYMKSTTNPWMKLFVIADYYIKLERVHFFRDGNSRLNYCILNKLLIENGFCPVIIEDFNWAYCKNPVELAIKLWAGMNLWSKIFGKKYEKIPITKFK
ncbi:MAG: hypothetical protein N4A49_05095 [Marinifilaceae bacterium]|jgi:hypothetical protein|nr:hypothetical protein [Marinifilaceae bacterium]